MLKLRFFEEAIIDFKKIDKPVREFFLAKLEQRCLQPHVPKDALKGELAGRYKIKSCGN